MKQSYFVDANIPMYAAGADSQWKDPSASFLMGIARGEFDALTSCEVLQEILHRYLRIGRRQDGFAVYDRFRHLVSEVISVMPRDMDDARQLLSDFPALTSRDAIHGAIARRYSLVIVSYDRHFDSVPFISRVEPDDLTK